MKANSTRPLSRFLVLYAFAYAAYGVASPFLPALLQSRGLGPEYIGVVFGVGTAVKVISAPLAGWIADRYAIRRQLVALSAAMAAASGLLYLAAGGVAAILAVHTMQSLALAPLSPLTDALALVASRANGHPRFEYGWVRGTGSAAFVSGTILVGLLIPAAGLPVILWCQAILLLGVPLTIRNVPEAPAGDDIPPLQREGLFYLLRQPVYRKVLVVAALVLGSHAMHDTFAVIRWTAAGISPATVGLLWSVSVVAEVIVFFSIGPWLLRTVAPAGAIAIAALAGAFRWGIEATTADPGVTTLLQLLHGFTFALLHLACMRLIAECVPPRLSATAQAVYGTFAVGLATASVTLLSGWLYGRMGPDAFAGMSLLCLAAIPVAGTLRKR